MLPRRIFGAAFFFSSWAGSGPARSDVSDSKVIPDRAPTDVCESSMAAALIAAKGSSEPEEVVPLEKARPKDHWLFILVSFRGVILLKMTSNLAWIFKVKYR